MFKSSENLRLAAEMRALQRVAGPWRESRTSWFDGTPDSIAARIAATDRVLTAARSGFTPAHLELTREAETARRELTAAYDRLLVDPIDDTARRTANGPLVHPDISFNNTMRFPGDKENNRFTLQNFRDVGPDETEEHRRQNPSVGIFNHDASEMLTNDGQHHWASRTAGAELGGGDVWHDYGNEDAYHDNPDDEGWTHDPHDGFPYPPVPGGHIIDDDYVDDLVDRHTQEGLDRSRDWGHLGSRVAAIEFLADQNTDDRQELLFRAHRHAADRTGQLPVPVAQRVVRDFVAAVNREIPARRPAPRTASAPQTVADFDDTLLYDN